MVSRTCDLLIKLTPKNKETVKKAVILLQKAHAINESDAKDILDSIDDIETLDSLDKLYDNFEGR